MAFAVTTLQAPEVHTLDATIYRLEDGAGGQADIWPALGFNCFRWQAVKAGHTLDLLYSDPALFSDGRPTRSGIPILFPFPNRIREGKFVWDGKTYQLPLNDGPKVNAIHGFACRRAWRVVDQGANDTSAWVTGEFHGDEDASDCRGWWPTDYRLRLTYRLSAGVLRMEAEVSNPDSQPMPFGLGYHPYFRLPFVPSTSPAICTVQVPAASYWELQESLPTGVRKDVDASRNLNPARPFTDLQLDDVLTSLPNSGGSMRECGTLVSGSDATLRLMCSANFREMVVFTPAHREAFCVEPYTCATDAINLQAQGIDAGWLTLPPGGTWSSLFEMRVG